MGYRSIVLNLQEPEWVEQVVNAAMVVGEANRSHLIGVHSLPMAMNASSVPYYLPPDVIQKIESNHVKRAEQVRESFEHKGSLIEFPTEWHLHKGIAGSGTKDLIEHVLSADLVVLSQGVRKSTPWLERDLLQKSTTPMLVAPSEPANPFRLGQITIAWNGSIQAARAIRDAMYLLERADSVRIICTGSISGVKAGQITGSDVATWLSHHDIEVTLDEHLERELKTGVDVATCAEEGGADMLVMGGYGHSPLYDALVGGMTDDVLAQSHIPVFLSH